MRTRVSRYSLSLFIALGLLLLLLSACRAGASREDDPLSLVWESWSIIQSSYVEADQLDAEKASGQAIEAMLQAADVPPYPFLTKLDQLKARPPRSVPEGLEDIWRAWHLLKESKPDLDDTMLAESATRGLLRGLEGPDASYLSQDAYHRATENLTGTYEGIGAYVNETEDGQAVIVGLIPGSPAEAAGLQEGDIIVAVDGEDVRGQSLEEVMAKVRGPDGTQVTLRVAREGLQNPLEFTITRGSVDLPSVDVALLPGAIGYVAITTFRDTTGDDFVTALERLKQAEALALILDLRFNPGGTVEAAQKVVSQFVSEGLVMYQVATDGTRSDVAVLGNPLMPDVPLAVVVNEFSASASEVVAGALQDHGRAKVFGTKTFGKGSTNTFKELPGGGALYIPVSYWYTPNGRQIEGVGIQPDVVSTISQQDIVQGVDRQLLDAYNYLDSLLPSTR